MANGFVIVIHVKWWPVDVSEKEVWQNFHKNFDTLFFHLIRNLSITDFSKHMKHFILFLHPHVAEHIAIYFQPMAQARAARTKTFCLCAPRLEEVEKK